MVKASSFRGVTWSKRHSKWQAGISLQGRSVQHAPAELPAVFRVVFATVSGFWPLFSYLTVYNPGVVTSRRTDCVGTISLDQRYHRFI
jgi:hypothetical protein